MYKVYKKRQTHPNNMIQNQSGNSKKMKSEKAGTLKSHLKWNLRTNFLIGNFSKVVASLTFARNNRHDNKIPKP